MIYRILTFRHEDTEYRIYKTLVYRIGLKPWPTLTFLLQVSVNEKKTFLLI